MEKIRIDEVDNSVQPAAVMGHLTEPLGVTDLVINYYELEPGDHFAFAYHNHEIQEELFYVQSGTATLATENGLVTVEEGEIIRFDHGEFQRGWNGATNASAHSLSARRSSTKSNANPGTVRSARPNPTADWNEPTTRPAVVASCERCSAETGTWFRGSMRGEVP